MLELFDVIWIFDRTTQPPKFKMNVCLSYHEGWFLRINTSAKFRPAVAIDLARNPWLDHDSNVQCALLVYDEFEIEESLKSPRNPVGKLHLGYRKAILNALIREPYIKQVDKIALGRLLG